VQTGAYELNGVALSLPTLVSRSGAGQVLEVPLSVNELLGLQGSAKTLAEIGESLKL
jgi:L-lactate dehydrogenase